MPEGVLRGVTDSTPGRRCEVEHSYAQRKAMRGTCDRAAAPRRGVGELGAERVYNPYDVLLLRRGRFAAHWFETGTPAFLVDTLCKRAVSSVSLDQTVSTEELLPAFDVDYIGAEALLFQTGYLTISGEQQFGGKELYRLGYPNREVRQSLNEHLLRHLVQDVHRQMANSMRLARLLEEHDCAGMKNLFQAFFASIPYRWYTNNDIANYEGFYASVFYSYFAALGYDITVEDSSSPRSPRHGRAHRRPHMPVRIQGSRDGATRIGSHPTAGAGLRRQVPGRRPTDPPHRRRVQPPNPQHHHLRHRRRLTSALHRSPQPGANTSRRVEFLPRVAGLAVAIHSGGRAARSRQELSESLTSDRISERGGPAETGVAVSGEYRIPPDVHDLTMIVPRGGENE